MTTDQTDHRSEAERLMREAASDPDDYVGAYEHLLAALHDGQREQTVLLRDLRFCMTTLAEALRPALNPGGHVAGPTDVHEAGGCDDCEPDTLVEALDALPVGTVIYDSLGDKATKGRFHLGSAS